MQTPYIVIEEQGAEIEVNPVLIFVVDGRTLVVYAMASGMFGGALVALAMAVGVWHGWLGMWVNL